MTKKLLKEIHSGNQVFIKNDYRIKLNQVLSMYEISISRASGDFQVYYRALSYDMEYWNICRQTKEQNYQEGIIEKSFEKIIEILEELNKDLKPIDFNEILKGII